MLTCESDFMEPMQRLSKDLRTAARQLGRKGARNLTDYYYQIQKFRTMAANEVRASADDEPNGVVNWVFENMRRMEDDIKKALGEFAATYNVGQWLQSITGIGPVLSAGFLAHLDITIAKTAAHFWRFAGLDPTVKWEKKTKRPWNARLKVLCFKAEDCFVKFQNHKEDHYGKLYVQRKAREQERNEQGLFADQAKGILEAKRFRDDTEAKKAYLQGKLPPAHVHMRAMRWTVKIFLSHLHHVMYVDYFGAEPPVPYSFEKCQGDHRHFIPVPNWPFTGDGESLKAMAE
jgi:hypothetical protein